MFEGLRKKFSDLVGSIVKKEETKAEEEAKQETKAEPAAIPKQEKEESKPSPIVKAPPRMVAMPEQKLHVAEKPPVHRQEEKKREVKKPEPAPTALITDKPKLSVTSKIKSVILGRVTIKDADVDELLEKFTFSLVEADVSYDVAERLTNEMRT
ncbi:MAG: signal recognition particle receptor subunit alpha, partial [Candidatus Micrarchaeota archaeon]|nr:signal recognition particle receptor subunit alpha [Candidatus Micrarchaeota archaeon]